MRFLRLKELIPVAALIAALGSAACGTRDLKEEEARAFPANFHSIRDRIIQPRCAGCHPTLMSYQALISELVHPGRASKSEFYTIIESKEMPQSGRKLSNGEIAAIKTWIDGGARND
jgi:uncharacterized membrane protein